MVYPGEYFNKVPVKNDKIAMEHEKKPSHKV